MILKIGINILQNRWGDDFCLVEFWIRSNIASVAAFLKMFIEVFNEIAEKQNLDPIPDEYINKL